MLRCKDGLLTQALTDVPMWVTLDRSQLAGPLAPAAAAGDEIVFYGALDRLAVRAPDDADTNR